MTYFWAKTDAEGMPGISVYEHMVNVGCVARCFAESFPDHLERFQLTISIIGALAALHDLGKISPGFQRKCPDWLEANNLLDVDRNGCWDTLMEADHGKSSHAAIQAFLSENGIDRTTAKFVSTVLGAHHGRLNQPSDRGYRSPCAITETSSNIDWHNERNTNALMIWEHFFANGTDFSLSDKSPSLWWLAGLTSVADWIGSDERFFPANKNEGPSDNYAAAKHALDVIGLSKTQIVGGLSFHDLFHDQQKPQEIWIPNEMQEKTCSMVDGPGVYVVEAPMGMGKTEAALWAAYHLLASGKATGIYFALPTQATSNRIHIRLNDFLGRITPEAPASRLIHANSWLMADDHGIYPTKTENRISSSGDARTGRDWFASSKRALIAPFGVGTVDQALLGIVASKHFFVRHFALAGKVVIIDEVHSYDLYTGTLIDKLITTLEGLGCTVIVLSATLTGKRREQIVSIPENEEVDIKLPYPLISGRSEGEPQRPLAATAPKPQTVKVDFVTTENAATEAISLAKRGGAVLWICNTVDAAQKQYRLFSKIGANEFPIGLLHSRFPFWQREKIEAEWMERLDKTGDKRCGCILCSTQIVEQSVDLDADLLITELAPTDMLLQRLGRLWRHKRGIRPANSAKICILKEKITLDEFCNMASEEIISAFGAKALVYDPFVLLRSLQVWKDYPKIIVPEQIRELIEKTYQAKLDDPESWQELDDKRFSQNSNEHFLAAMNSNYWQPQLLDAEGVQTRLNDVPTVSVVLCQRIDPQEVVFIDGASGQLDEGRFILSTAQGIHRNLVRVPEYCFDRIEPFIAFSRYIFGSQTIGLVNEDHLVEVGGLKAEKRLFYDEAYGLIIEN